LKLRTRALALRRAAPAPASQANSGAAQFEIDCDVAGRRETIPARAVVLATPARASASLLAPVAPAAAFLAGIEYAPVAVVGGSYASEHLKRPLNGFGFLAPRTEGTRVLGTVWNSSLFPGRAPEDQVMLTSFVGGATDPAAASLPEGPLYQTVESELRRILGIFFSPKIRFAQRWPQAIPQYNLGHAELIRRVRAALVQTPGVFLAGNYLDGPSVGACVETANRVAEQAAAFLSAPLTAP
ncbi:MAG TPA: protoporphyrinogen oxidase, partial [Candidatus Acidoferrales bacterium]|nr:protoporphyrinogen oxidase [Candidatus Acidoferrales bacterium]